STRRCSRCRISVKNSMSVSSLYAPGRNWKTRCASVPSGSYARPPANDNRFQLNRWCSTGVQPLGAHVARTDGSSETPDSSSNMIRAFGRCAVFLGVASVFSPTGGWLPRCFQLLDEPVAANSSSTHGGGCTRRGRGGTRHPSAARSPQLHAATSTDRWRSHG